MPCSNGWRIKRTCRRVLLTVHFILAPQAMAAIPEDWKKTPYAHEATNRALGDFLQDLVHTLGLQLHIDGQLQGVVHGKLRSDTLKGFLDRLALEYRFQWFVYNNTLYISSLDQQTSARLEVADNAITDLKQALTQMGLFDDRFGWGELPELGVVLVSGPKRYIEQIREFSRKRTEPVDKQDVLAFALQFANAADRQIDYRGEKLTIPGIASLLRSLLDSKSQLFSGLEPNAAMQPSASAPPQGTLLPPTGSRVRVEADVRNNSVLIYDSRQRQALYQTLMAQLDIPRKLVEIDAVILDINRTQLKNLGINWGFQNRRFQINKTSLSSASYSTFPAARMDRFTADVKALEERGLATVVSNPSIMTLENQPAVIDFNRTQYIKAVGEGVANILPVTAGTSFQVIPRVITSEGGNQIHLIIDIEDGTFSDIRAADSTPDVRKSKVSTQAVIAEKQSLVIGGFHVADEVDSLNKVPLLSSIPLLGKLLFSSSETSKSRQERLFILTPRLVGDQINPARYLPQSDLALLEAASAPLARRYAQHLPVIKRTDVADTLASLVLGRVPKNFTVRPMPVMADTWCKAPVFLKAEPASNQWYESPQYNVAVIVLHNQSDKPVRIDESECSNERTLAVSVWPRPWLRPGEKAEVFIVTRPTGEDEPLPRPSLLVPTRGATR